MEWKAKRKRGRGMTKSRRSTGTVPRRKQLRSGGNREDLKKKKKMMERVKSQSISGDKRQAGAAGK